MINNIIKTFVFLFLIFITFNTHILKADGHTPNMDFNFLPKFVHYQGEIKVNGKSLSEIDTGIEFLEVIFTNPKQVIQLEGKQVEIDQGQFVFKTYYGDPISSKYHIDIGPGVPEGTKFDVIVAGVKADESIIFDPSPKGGCPVSNCFNRTVNINISSVPIPTPTPVPPTPTPIPTVNPSFYSGQIIIGSSPVPDDVEVFAKIGDYISEMAITSEGRYTLNVNPKTANYVGQNIKLVIQGNESMTSIPFSPDEFISDANFLFQNFDLVIDKDPIPTPEPEKIIVVATPTPQTEITVIAEEPVIINDDSGGCGGGSSKISIFSVLVSGLLILLLRKSKKFHISFYKV